MKRLKLSSTLYLLTALQLLFMLVVGVTGLVAIRRTSQGLTTVYNDRVVPLKQLKTIADAYAVSVIDAVNKANAGLTTAEETRKGLVAASEDIRKNWLAYKATTLTAEEADLARRAEQLFVPADKSVAALLQRLEGKSGTLKDSLGDFDGPLYASVDPISSAITGLVDLQLRVAEVEYRDAERRYGTTLRFVGCLLLFGAICSGGLGWWVSRSVSGTIRNVAHGLAVSAEQTAAAAGQVSTTSQLLAEATNEQAASLEETGSSLEELSSMTQRNASSTQQANELAKEARVAADQGAADMNVMDHAMGDIRTASGEIAKILKSIDEIAFQTNLLALNAAVEAARAGEAGMGFAVVADEVRGLAQRAATAARETATMVENAVRSSSQGLEVSSRVSLALAQIVAKARAVDELVAQVAAASAEQSQGIAQLNTAVSQIDQVTQGNAATSEESAAAAEELNAQADMMRHAVNDLLALVNGESGPGGEVGSTGSQATGAPAQAALLASPRGVRQGRPVQGTRAKPPASAHASSNGARKPVPEFGGTGRR